MAKATLPSRAAFPPARDAGVQDRRGFVEIADDDSYRVGRPVAGHVAADERSTTGVVLRLDGQIACLYVLGGHPGGDYRVDHLTGLVIRLGDRPRYVRGNHLDADVGIEDVRRSADLP